MKFVYVILIQEWEYGYESKYCNTTVHGVYSSEEVANEVAKHITDSEVVTVPLDDI